jgi:hypothetical protein
VSSRKASNLLLNAVRRIADWLKVPNGLKARASSVAEEPLNSSEPGAHWPEPAEKRV